MSDTACDSVLTEKLLGFEGIMRSASDLEVIDGSLSADGKGIAMIQFEKVALFAAPPRPVDERALSAISREDFSPHGGRHVP